MTAHIRIAANEQQVGGPDGIRVREFDNLQESCLTPKMGAFPSHFPIMIAPHPLQPATKRNQVRVGAALWPDIRARAQHESLRALAAAYGVSHETIRRIILTDTRAQAREHTHAG
jgi:hypothetical protein